MKKTQRHSFTMVEILMVTALIAILAAIGFGAYSYAMGRSKESATRSVISQLEAGLGAFHAKYGYYPPAAAYGTITVSRDSSNMVQAITFGSGSGTGDKYTIGYTTAPGSARQKALKEEELRTFMNAVEFATLARFINSSGVIEDAWGGSVRYRAPGKINTTGCDLIAPGEDGAFGSGKASTPPDSLASYKDGDNDWICDDIANF